MLFENKYNSMMKLMMMMMMVMISVLELFFHFLLEQHDAPARHECELTFVKKKNMLMPEIINLKTDARSIFAIHCEFDYVRFLHSFTNKASYFDIYRYPLSDSYFTTSRIESQIQNRLDRYPAMKRNARQNEYHWFAT
jgi:hypothetical protein